MIHFGHISIFVKTNNAKTVHPSSLLSSDKHRAGIRKLEACALDIFVVASLFHDRLLLNYFEVPDFDAAVLAHGSEYCRGVGAPLDVVDR